MAAKIGETGGPVVGRGTVDGRGVGGSFAGCIADVEVDPETGKTTVVRFTSVQDAGKAIHPSYVEGQMQGGSVQGIGWALNEEYYMSGEGSMMNSSLLDYRMPTSRGRGQHRAAAGSDRQCDLSRRRCADAPVADESARRHAGYLV